MQPTLTMGQTGAGIFDTRCEDSEKKFTDTFVREADCEINKSVLSTLSRPPRSTAEVECTSRTVGKVFDFAEKTYRDSCSDEDFKFILKNEEVSYSLTSKTILLFSNTAIVECKTTDELKNIGDHIFRFFTSVFDFIRSVEQQVNSTFDHEVDSVPDSTHIVKGYVYDVDTVEKKPTSTKNEKTRRLLIELDQKSELFSSKMFHILNGKMVFSEKKQKITKFFNTILEDINLKVITSIQISMETAGSCQRNKTVIDFTQVGRIVIPAGYRLISSIFDWQSKKYANTSMKQIHDMQDLLSEYKEDTKSLQKKILHIKEKNDCTKKNIQVYEEAILEIQDEIDKNSEDTKRSKETTRSLIFSLDTDIKKTNEAYKKYLEHSNKIQRCTDNVLKKISFNINLENEKNNEFQNKPLVFLKCVSKTEDSTSFKKKSSWDTTAKIDKNLSELRYKISRQLLGAPWRKASQLRLHTLASSCDFSKKEIDKNE